MKNNTIPVITIVLLMLLATSFGCTKEKEPDPVPEPAVTDQGTLAQIQELYEKAKDAGEQVPLDAYEWARQDLGSIGDWEYLVIDIPEFDAARAQKKLNELGTERWECIWIQPSGNKISFVLKRPTRSYLKSVPLSQILKLLPRTESDGE
jgi:hypothetical protein